MWTSTGLRLLLDAGLGGAALGNLTMKLFKNNITPTAASVTADFTEADFTGYTAKTLTDGSWGAASVTAGVASAAYAQQEWEATASGDSVYGVYIVNSSNVCVGHEKFDSPQTIVDGTIIRANPISSIGQSA